MTEAVAERPRALPPLGRPALARWAALAVPAALLAAAFGSQYLGGLYPCEMCWWQRYAHLAALVPAALAFTAPAPSPRARLMVLLAAAGIALSGTIGVYHAGVELKIFEGFTTCTTVAAGATTDELFRQLAAAPVVRCDQVQWSFLGISMAGWNAILSLGAAAAIGFLTLRSSRS
ncbi:MAG TPA: disulfide bond formation protein B [Sphingomicrobium sp.]|nr:disulfide bond formation protein B [Sphingomicrobium sp.]